MAVDNPAGRARAELVLGASAVGPSGHRRGQTVAAPALHAGRRYSFLPLFARAKGSQVGFVGVGERHVERIRAIQVGGIGLAAEPVP